MIVWFLATVLLVGLYILVGEISFRHGKAVGWTEGYADRIIEENKKPIEGAYKKKDISIY